ncbi:hypothetical protein [Hwangdonia lutea]|uniref:Uncharacterized protein n=1 Tax=Hwangdonia lutea TaxID=3075823 RepID=A0AA97EJG9_9FLAO|nr:hypothetical protein [Hwangdonia sp. SCSIO 19198]WOD42186.1 hypothetical protein RNZ46_09275 [Hwangdonia sp. SCSIO 19198]
MKLTAFLFFFISAIAFPQKSIETTFVKKIELKAETIVSVDKFSDYEVIKYVDNNTLFRKHKDAIIYNYSNVQLGDLTSVDAFSPLKIKLFYKSFNTVVILDNRLSEMDKIDFNTVKPYKNVSHVSTGFGSKLWIFNQDLQQLELYNYKTGEVYAKSIPVESSVIQLVSSYNHCWLLTKKYLYKYDAYGSLIYKIENKNYTAMVLNFDNIVLQSSDKNLHYLPKNSQVIAPIKTPKLLINQFLLNRGSLYLYDNEFLHEYQLIKD